MMQFLLFCFALTLLPSWKQVVPGVESFNLEPRLPVIKKGQPGSYFGFSVAEHLSSGGTPWILVGAPLGQNLQPNTTRSGALFKCPLTLDEGECSQVVTDGKRSISSDRLYGPSSDEFKDGQWLGVNVRSQGKGGKVMVCAHRYIHQGPDFRWGLGLCHFLNEDLTHSQTLEPCRNKQRNGLQDFGFCQVGTSGYLLEDDTALMGAPGAYTCRGTIYGISVSDDYLNKDRQHYHSPFGGPQSPVEAYSYLGMSVTGGNFFGSKLSYATGAPKAAQGSGQVLFFTKNSSEVLQAEGALTGEIFASSFGYELAALDLNGDNRSDLAVGAPFYMDHKIGGDGGAVYVYLNNANGFNEKSAFVKLTGPPESRFGFALASLGDVNHDGFEDLAVGAPYDEEGRGTVFIHLGSIDGIVREPSQVIRASKFFPDLRTFGYSLSGAIDLDGNSYPDLLVGAYESSAAVLLRSRPIVDITTEIGELTGIDPSTYGCPEDLDAATVCFKLETCFEIREAAKLLVASLGVNYTLEEKPGKKYSRIYFKNGLVDRNHTVQKDIYVGRSKIGKHCEKEIVYLKKPTTDIQTPISFLLTLALIQREPRYQPNLPLPSIQNYPILNQQEAFKSFQVYFEKDCGEDDVCESDLFLLTTTELAEDESGRYVLVLGSGKEFILNISLRNLGEPAYEAMLYIEHPSSMPFIAPVTNSTTLCYPFNNTLVACHIGNPYKRKEIEDIIGVRFDASSLKEIQTRLDFNVWANSTSIEWDDQNNFNSVVVVVVKVAELYLRWLSTPKEVTYSGVIKGETAMHSLSDIGNKVVHTYEVINDGPSRASHFNLEIRWPHQVGNNNSWAEGKWLLYMERVEIIGDGECFVPSDAVNVLNLPGESSSVLPITSQEAQTLRRTKRDTETIVSPEIVIDNSGRKTKVVKMDCLRGSAICITIVCVVRSLLPTESAHINVHSRLWNSTLVEDYPLVDAVYIYSRAQLRIPDDNRQDLVNDVANALTIATPDLKLKVDAEGVAWWIYLIAGILGILVLLLIIFCLYRLGFFIRRRPQPTHTASIVKS